MNGDVGIKFAILMLVGVFGAVAVGLARLGPNLWVWFWALPPLDAMLVGFVTLAAIGFVGAVVTLSGHAQMTLTRPPPRPPYPADPETRR